jgi:hypothetical protein
MSETPIELRLKQWAGGHASGVQRLALEALYRIDKV